MATKREGLVNELHAELAEQQSSEAKQQLRHINTMDDEPAVQNERSPLLLQSQESPQPQSQEPEENATSNRDSRSIIVDISTNQAIDKYQLLLFKLAISTQNIVLSELDRVTDFTGAFELLQQCTSLQEAVSLTVYVLRRLGVEEVAIQPLSRFSSQEFNITAESSAKPEAMFKLDYMLSLWEVVSNMYRELPEQQYNRFITLVQQKLLPRSNKHNLRKPARLIDALVRGHLLEHKENSTEPGGTLETYFQCVVDIGGTLEPLREFCGRHELIQPNVTPSRTDRENKSQDGFCSRHWKIVLGIITVGIFVMCLLLFVGGFTGCGVYISKLMKKVSALEEGVRNKTSVGSLPREIGHNFDTSHIGKIKLSILNYTNTTNVTSYKGECSEVSYQTTHLSPVTVHLTNITANSPVPVNYSHSAIMFALPGSNFTYDVSFNTSTEISTHEAGYALIYLFNTLESYKTFLKSSGKTKVPSGSYLNKSECIKVKQESPPFPVRNIIDIASETFIFGAVIANVSYNANITISGFRQEYDVSQLERQQINSSFTVIDLCDSTNCNYFAAGGKDYCVFVNSTKYTQINYTEYSVSFPIYNHTVLKDVIVVVVSGFVALLAAIGILVITCCCVCCWCCKRTRRKKVPNTTAIATANNGQRKGSFGEQSSNSSNNLSKDSL